MKFIESLSNIDNFPHKITIDKSTYFILKEDSNYYLASNICPHQGGEIDFDNGLYCKVHNWKFDSSGDCTNVSNISLYKNNLIVRKDKLYSNEDLDSSVSAKFKTKKSSNKKVLFKIHAHACAEIIHDDFSILTDPWLEGLAFMGAWKHSPKPIAKIENLCPNAICITHEHSDHFHEESISKFNKNTLVLFPDFPNKRIEKSLKKLGFSNIIPMEFGNKYDLSDKIKVSCYEPQSVWNDSIFHFDIDGFNVLNINDAGLNFRIKKYLPKIDLLMSSFSPGASGFPLCWKNFTTEEKISYYKKAKKGMIDMLERACELYGADFLLPFASHFDLHHPDHEEYRDILKEYGKNTVDDVKNNINNVEVIDILPGESWNCFDGRTFRIYNNDKIKERIYSKKMLFDSKNFNKFYPKDSKVQLNELHKYLLSLNNVPEICLCEDISVRLNDTYFTIKSGKLQILSPVSDYDLSIDVPENILSSVISNDISWDEAHIGYWCKLYRKGEEFNQQFWRLLQAPYYKKNQSYKINDKKGITESSNISTILEKYPESGSIFGRYGLYCFSCANAWREDVGQAAKYHGLDNISKSNLIKELNYIAERC